MCWLASATVPERFADFWRRFWRRRGNPSMGVGWGGSQTLSAAPRPLLGCSATRSIGPPSARPPLPISDLPIWRAPDAPSTRPQRAVDISVPLLDRLVAKGRVRAAATRFTPVETQGALLCSYCLSLRAVSDGGSSTQRASGVSRVFLAHRMASPCSFAIKRTMAGELWLPTPLQHVLPILQYSSAPA